MSTTTLDNQVAIIQNSIELFRSAPEILKANQDRTAKALNVGRSILAQWQEAWAIEDEEQKILALSAADERSNKYLVNCSTALKEEKEARAAITQMMDEFKKMFTAAENELDRAKAGTVTNQVQGNRDEYVKESAKIQERKRREAERAAAKAKEAIDVKSNVEIQLAEYFNDYLLAKKKKLTEFFNNLKLEGFADDAAQIRTYTPEYKLEHFSVFKPVIYASYLTLEEVQALTAEAKEGQFEKLSARYVEEMTAIKNDLKAKIPSKHEELKEAKRLADEAEAERKRQEEAEAERRRKIEAANAAERERLEKEAAEQRKKEAERLEQMRKQQEEAEAERKRREQEEQERMEREAAQAKENEALQAEAKKQAEHTMVMFEQEAAVADMTPAPEARQGYEITVLHQAGYVQIFQLWFEKEGKTLPVDKLGNTKLDQMKAWAEKHAHKTGEKIESKFLRYEESYKAVNRKAK